MPEIVNSTGGLAFGSTQGPQLDFIPTPAPGVPRGKPEELKRYAVLALRDAMHWQRITQNEMPSLPRSWMGIMGQSKTLIIRLSYPANDNPVNALRNIEEHEAKGAPPSSIFGALLVAAVGIERRLASQALAGAVLAFTRSVAGLPALQGYAPETAPLSRRDVEALVSRHITPRQVTPFPALRPLDTARVALEIGRQLWLPQWQRADIRKLLDLASTQGFVVRNEREWLPSLAGVDLVLRGGKLDLLGVPLTTEHIGASLSAWLVVQAIFDSAPELSGEVIRALYPDGRFSVSDDSTSALFTPPETFSAYETQLLDTARAMIEKAEREKRYEPTGTFRVRVPTELPISANAKYLLIYPEANGLFWRVCNPTPSGMLFWWRVGDMKAGHPELCAILAALWHDLHVGGQEAFPLEEAPDTPPPSPERAPGDESKTATRRRASHISLPRTRLALSGKRRWGGEAERQAARQWHAVTSHPMRLRPGTKRSEDKARYIREHGIIAADNETYRIYTQGRGKRHASDKTRDGAAFPEPIRVRAQGLTTLLALFRREQDNTEGNLNHANPA